ncbi:MAG: Trimethylamine corrinoid protein MtbC1 [Candidatus Methanohalarchaeum thermophilum]|uniref:Trimethylamine corrinoid protein MtbC1 n=1 Tax=Methanohalarchaeum thermophilum TaxID=1903181 RepID=A0A1Q6DVN2_METT1|nr:MAG: Trimethylamine corrinoid protein MtbC1 [Candidatus Methanohalarchaeum thermophilum]
MMTEKEEILEGLKDSVIEQDEDKARELAEKALDEDIAPFSAISDGLAKGMEVIGDKFDADELYLPQVMMSADAMEAAMEVLRPALQEGDGETKGTVVLGTVEGDIHSIGKDVVSSMIEGAGFRVIDIGKDKPPEEFVEKAKEEAADVIGASALMSTTRPEQENIIDELGDRDIKTIFGGAPVTEEFVNEIGGDAYAVDGSEARKEVEKLME